MPRGKVKWYNPDKGYGFITAEDGKESIFISEDALPRGLYSLAVDQLVDYTLDEQRGKKRVRSIVLI